MRRRALGRSHPRSRSGAEADGEAGRLVEGFRVLPEGLADRHDELDEQLACLEHVIESQQLGSTLRVGVLWCRSCILLL